MCNFKKKRLEARGYPKSLIESTLSGVSFAGRQSALKKQTKQTKGKIMPFVTTYHPGGKKLKTNTDAKMKSHPKSASCWKQFVQRLLLYHTKKENRSKIWSSEQNL